MKRTEFFQLIQPLTEKLFRYAYALLPDDLQAEQLVVDGVNAYLMREKRHILRKELNLLQKKEIQIQRRQHFKGILRLMAEVGVRRAGQLGEQMKLSTPSEFAPFFSLDPKVRFALKLRFEGQFNVEEIEDILMIPRYEVIEKLHNGRFLLLNNLNAGVNV